ncbi:MAG TPA: DinB family protein [Anaerolineaceae bacterium]|nr:DinB family protein [Anaerolineaceae bacterium]
MKANDVLRTEVLALLRGGNAHMPFEEAVADFPPDAYNRFPPQVPYSPWHLLEHLRITQSDILEFVRDPKYVSPVWPEGYWPAPGEQADRARWEETIRRFCADLCDIQAIVEDPSIDLLAEIPHAPGYTYLREALLVADHNAYHIGEFAILRQVMGTWK